MSADTQQGTTVSRAVVEELGALIHEKHLLTARQQHTQAMLIRGCIAAIRQTTEQAARKLERERRHLSGVRAIVRMHEPGERVRRDKELAFLHLEWLATQLEDASAPVLEGLT